MIKHLFLSLIFFLTALVGWSQNEPDSITSADIPECENIAYNSSYLIMKYYKNHDYDSALLVLNDWQTACGASEPIYRTRILLAIRDNAFDETIYDSTMVDYVLNYINRMEAKNPEEYYINYKSYFGYVPIRGDYDFFTQSIADELLSLEFETPLELLFCQFYANIITNPFNAMRKDTLYNKTYLKSYYYNEVDKYRFKPDFHFEFNAGTWIPTGNAATLGVHPIIGAQAGVRVQKMTYNFSLAIKFADTPDDYLILRDGLIDSTRYFFGGYIGLDVERLIFKTKKQELSMLAGVGFDGFAAINKNLEDDNTDNDIGHSINSLNTNLGLSYRYFYKKNRYIGVQGKYNIVNYNNQGGTNLSGDCYTVSISIGGFGNPDKDYYLSELRYDE
jgi:hypothetical protein